MIHELKIKPEYLAAVVSGDKTFEIRNNADRNFKVGDTLLLWEWDEGFTSQTAERTVSYITDFEQKPGYVVLGLANKREQELAEQLADATRQCGVMADLLREAIGEVPQTQSFPSRCDAALAGKMPDRQDTEWTDAATSPIAADYRELQGQHDQLQSKYKGALDLLQEAHEVMRRIIPPLPQDCANRSDLLDRIEVALAGKQQNKPVTITETIRTAPERIWLQVGDQSSDGDYPSPEHHDEVTWCADSVVACEVPYVRADLVDHVVSQPLRLLIQMADILKMCRSALITAYEDILDGTAKGVIQYRIKLATKGINMAEHAIDAAAQASSGRFITEGQELELITVLQSIVNGFSDDPAHDAAALLKRITGEVQWTGDSFQLPSRQGGEPCDSASPSSSPA
ncbi:ASCH/PUA domain-containing protein [Aeromonas veronii]